jgi:hypothetical protein
LRIVNKRRSYKKVNGCKTVVPKEPLKNGSTKKSVGENGGMLTGK